MLNDINAGKHVVNRQHHSWIPTAEILADLEARYPNTLFPYMDQDHVAGVQSNVHAFCEKHEIFSRLSVSGARHAGQKYACTLCASENRSHHPGASKKHYSPGYVGRVGVQSGIFRAVKAVFPDAVWEYRMENGKEIDIYVPSLRAGIEYNGNFYHSTAVGKDADYHKNKTRGAAYADYIIINVWSDEAVAPYTNLVNQLRLVPESYDANRKVKQVKAKQVSRAEASAFYRTWNYRLPDTYLGCSDVFVGAFDEKRNLVAVCFGIGEKRVVIGAATSDVTINFGTMYARFKSLCGGDAPASVLCYTLNPIETFFMSRTFNCHALGFVREPLELGAGLEALDAESLPDVYPMNSRFEIDLNLPVEDATALAYGCRVLKFYA